MSNHLSILNFENQPIQSLVKNGEIYFRATNLAELLEYQNPHDAIKTHVDKDDLAKYEVVDSVGRKQKINFVNESGMFALVLGSKQEKAKKVKHWVTSEVLPSIRKTGSYTHTINPEQQYQVKEAVMQLARKTGKKHPAIYRDLYNHFKIPRYQDLLAKDFQAALKFLEWSEPKQIAQSENTLLIPFNLVRNGTYQVLVRNGKALKRSIMYAEDARDIGTLWGSPE